MVEMNTTKTQICENFTKLDDIYSKLSLLKYYYIKFFVLFFCCIAVNTMSFSNYIFVAEAVHYRCADVRFENKTCESLSNSEVCSEWIYDNPHSFMAEFNLACEEWKRVLIGSVHNFGFACGIIISGPISDRIGRIKTIVLESLLGATMGITKSFITNYWLYIFLEFMQAGLGDPYITIYILTAEMFSSKRRVVAIAIINFGISLGFTLLSLLAWSVPYWRHLLLGIYVPIFLFISYILFIDESPRWLLSKGKKDEAIVVLKNMAKKSDITLDDNDLENLVYEEKDETIKLVDLIKSTITSTVLMKRFLLAVAWWFSSTFLTHGLRVNSVSIMPGNKYLSFAMSTPADAFGKILLMCIVVHFRKKLPLAITFFLIAIFSLGQVAVPAGINWLPLFLFYCAKMMTTVCIHITYLYSVELFPTYTRSSMVGLCSGFGRVGSTLAPITPLLSLYWNVLPSLTFGLVALLAGLLTLFAPDTASEPLPDNVSQAEALGHKEKLKEDDKKCTKL